jgi:hypothetical protein
MLRARLLVIARKSGPIITPRFSPLGGEPAMAALNLSLANYQFMAQLLGLAVAVRCGCNNVTFRSSGLARRRFFFLNVADFKGVQAG